MSIIDVAADLASPVAPGVSEIWALGRGSSAPDARVRVVPVVTPGGIEAVAAQIGVHRAAGGIAVVAITPGGMGFPLVPWAVSPIPELCAREEIALMIAVGAADVFPWADLVAFARTYPRLAVIATGAPLAGPTAAKAMDATANLILDTSGPGAGAHAAGLALRAGTYRVAFGSGRSRTNAADAVAGLGEVDAAAVLAGTATHLAAGTWSKTFL